MEMDPKWGFISMVDRLTNGDITKDELVYDIEYISCMTRLLFWKEKDDYIDKLNKAEEAQNKAKHRV